MNTLLQIKITNEDVLKKVQSFLSSCNINYEELESDTIYLSKDKELKKSIIEGMQTPLDDNLSLELQEAHNSITKGEGMSLEDVKLKLGM